MISPAQKLQMNIRTMPMMTRIPPSEIPMGNAFLGSPLRTRRFANRCLASYPGRAAGKRRGEPRQSIPSFAEPEPWVSDKRTATHAKRRDGMAELTTLDEKLAEVLGLAQAAQGATEKVEGMVEDEEIVATLKRMREEAEETERRCADVADSRDGKKSAILEKAQE